jgi:hypothetical protein
MSNEFFSLTLLNLELRNGNSRFRRRAFGSIAWNSFTAAQRNSSNPSEDRT